MRALSVGVMAGGLSGLFGVGGGVLIVPGLVMLSGMRQHVAHGTSLAAIVPIATGGVIGYGLEGALDWPAAGLVAAGGAAGAILGARLLERVPEAPLRRGFALFMLVAAAALLLHVAEGAGRGPLTPPTMAALVALGIVAGVLAGLLGVGGGIVVVPAMILLLSVPDAVAKGTSLLVIIPTAVAGTVQNARAGNVDIPAAAAVGLGGLAAAFGASLVSVRLDPRLSSALFAALLIALATRLLLRR
ncbi:MAG TPA: sulfite exporter TauE/SafE family protein [Actinomycetota bacterium]|jgi:hypothetical protein